MNFKNISIIIFALSIGCFSVNAQNGTTWQLTGPDLFPTNASGQVNGIGRVCQIKFHATNPLKMYAVSASGGLWISSDSSHTWAKTGTDNLPATACASVCIDYTNDNIIYLGTGDPNYYCGSYGIWKSNDGGATWTQSTTGLGNLLPVEILMSPTDNNILVTATENGIYKSINAGVNWSLVKTGGDFKDMQFQPGSNTILYAVTSSEFWRSVDFGSTWTQITSGIVVPGGGSGNGMRIAVSPANVNLVYVGMVAGDGTILKSLDAGLNFSTVYHSTSKSLVGYDSTDIGGGQGDYNFSLTCDPTNANNVFLVSHIVWRSMDGGINWNHLTDWWDQLHTDMHCIKFHPTFTNKFFNANDGGVWLSDDHGDNWIPRSDGIGATEVYHASQSPIKRDMISIGTQDNGELYFSANEWKTNRGGDWGSRSAFDYLVNNRVYYFENGNRRPVTGSETSYNLPFSATNNIVLEFPKSLPNFAFSGEQNAYRTTTLNNASPTWTQISTFNQQIKAMFSSPADSNILYVVSSNTKVYRSDNALATTPTFTMLSAPGSTGVATSIAALKNNANIVYMSCGSAVYRSANKGSNWTNITNNLPGGVNIIKVITDVFSNNEAVYVGTAKGVYFKDSGTTTWQNISYNLPTVADIQDFMIYNPGNAASILRVAYYGRGVWELPINTSFPPVPEFIANVTTICPGETINFTDASIGSPQSWSWSFQGGTPSTSTSQNPIVTYAISGNYSVTLTVTNANGSNSLTQTSYILVTAPLAIPFAEGFTTSITPSNWTNFDANNNNIIWQQSINAGGYGTSSESAFFDNYNYDVSGSRDELRTPQFDFTSNPHPVLVFDRAYGPYGVNYEDSLAVLVSPDCGTTFDLLYLKGYSDLATAPANTGSTFVPTASQWKKDTIDLLSYGGQNNIMFSFQNRGHYGQAIYLDNVNIGNLFTTTNQIIPEFFINSYPNPLKDNLYIEYKFNTNEEFKALIYDSQGKKVAEQILTGNKTQFDMRTFKAGLYQLIINTNTSQKYRKKIIKID